MFREYQRTEGIQPVSVRRNEQIVIANSRGGLGNQLFILAAGKLLADALSTSLLVDEFSCFARDRFGRAPRTLELATNVQILPRFASRFLRMALRPLPPSALRRVGVLVVRSDSVVAEMILRATCGEGIWLIVLDGYFQALPSILGRRFDVVHNGLNSRHNAMLHDNRPVKEEPGFGAIHLRLNWGPVPAGDRLKLELPVQYFLDVLERALRVMELSKWIVFTDSADQSIKLLQEVGFREDYVFAEDAGFIGDLSQLNGLAAADVLVLSNSTYSWWAGTRCLQRGGIVFSPPMERYGQLCSAPDGAIVWSPES